MLLLLALLGAPPADATRVLVVANRKDADSVRIARYYMTRRKVPAQSLVLLDTESSEEISRARYEAEIQTPVEVAIKKAKAPKDFILLVRGVPIRIADWGYQGGYSVDAVLAADGLPIVPIDKLDEPTIRRSVNPYFGKSERFRADKFGFRLVTRLDGYTAADALALVDNSLAAKPWRGPFFFDEAGNRKAGGYVEMQSTLSRADAELRARRFDSSVDQTATFVAPEAKLAGYTSWGSNDDAFDEKTYARLRFLPGALAETFVSTSGRTFRPTSGGQSLVADLIASRITGVKGYVSETYTFALARPDILFNRYTSGYNLAESFYMASPILKWKDVVIGDPLCRPYGK